MFDWIENTLKSEYFPLPDMFLCPFESMKYPPGECAASSIIHKLCLLAKFLNSSKLTGSPPKFTGIIPLKKPFGLLLINSLVFSNEIKYDFGSMSANQTSAPQYLIQLAVAAMKLGW